MSIPYGRIRTPWCWESGPRRGLHSGVGPWAGYLCRRHRRRLRGACLAGVGADGAWLKVVQQEQMFVELLDGGEKGLFSVDCFKSWNGIVYWLRKPGKRLVLLQLISRPPNDMLAYVFPAVSTPGRGNPSLLNPGLQFKKMRFDLRS